MFVVLDTNHYDELANDSVFGQNARRRIESHLADVFISVVSVQESVQGWMALINRKRPGHKQVHAYARFQNCIETLTKLTILPFDSFSDPRAMAATRKPMRRANWIPRWPSPPTP